MSTDARIAETSNDQQARRRPVPDEIMGGRWSDAFLLALEVTSAESIAPHIRSITVRSPDLIGFEHAPGQDVMFDFRKDERVVRRRYTIRRCDPRNGTAEFEVEIHPGRGPATAWALEAAPGSHIDAIGPRGKITLRDGAPSHLFIADDSGMPAAFAMLEALPAEISASAVLLTPHGTDSRPVPDRPGALTWLTEAHLSDALEPRPDAAVYVLGELGLVRRARELLAERAFSEDLLAAKAYWRRDQPNAEHGEP